MNGSFQSLTLLHYMTEETNNNKTMAKHKELRRVAYLSNLTRKLNFPLWRVSELKTICHHKCKRSTHA